MLRDGSQQDWADQYAQSDGKEWTRQEDFLEESLEATTMHEPLPYPSDRLEYLDQLQPDQDND